MRLAAQEEAQTALRRQSLKDIRAVAEEEAKAAFRKQSLKDIRAAAEEEAKTTLRKQSLRDIRAAAEEEAKATIRRQSTKDVGAVGHSGLALTTTLGFPDVKAQTGTSERPEVQQESQQVRDEQHQGGKSSRITPGRNQDDEKRGPDWDVLHEVEGMVKTSSGRYIAVQTVDEQ